MFYSIDLQTHTHFYSIDLQTHDHFYSIDLQTHDHFYSIDLQTHDHFYSIDLQTHDHFIALTYKHMLIFIALIYKHVIIFIALNLNVYFKKAWTYKVSMSVGIPISLAELRLLEVSIYSTCQGRSLRWRLTEYHYSVLIGWVVSRWPTWTHTGHHSIINFIMLRKNLNCLQILNHVHSIGFVVYKFQLFQPLRCSLELYLSVIPTSKTITVDTIVFLKSVKYKLLIISNVYFMQYC